MEIISNQEFQTKDIQGINWDQVNEELGTEDDNTEWLDDNAGWMCTPVTILVPYQSHHGIPSEPGAGPQNYTVANFQHQSLVSIIKEKILGLQDSHVFHFEPHWQ